MSSVTIDDELYQRVRETASARGTSVEAFVRQALEQSLQRGEQLPKIERNGVLVMAVKDTAPPIDPEVVRRHLQEEG
jgi:metal-responsive CopG/Arc/MetJ family transcriptional regulator